jgi:hypothetical protein
MTSQILIADGNHAWYRFDRVQRWLHWTMAALIFAMIPLGAISAYLPAGQQPRQGLLEVHKSLGFTILVLLIVRIIWRLVAGEPRYRIPLGRLVHLASRAGHIALYGLMLFMPITGYLYSAAGGIRCPGSACSSGLLCCRTIAASPHGENCSTIAAHGLLLRCWPGILLQWLGISGSSATRCFPG